MQIFAWIHPILIDSIEWIKWSHLICRRPKERFTKAVVSRSFFFNERNEFDFETKSEVEKRQPASGVKRCNLRNVLQCEWHTHTCHTK